MAVSPPSDPHRFVHAIRESGLTIYDPIAVGDVDFWIPSPELETLLNDGMRGLSLAGLPLRTRSKVVKTRVCEVLGYPIPSSFRKTHPRFPGQMLDTYAQKSNNLQVWNEELSGVRRYAIIRVSSGDTISRVKVVTGETLALLDTTGTITQKYQARCTPGMMATELISSTDTAQLLPLVFNQVDLKGVASPTLHPTVGQLLPIQSLFESLKAMVGERIIDVGADQERNRGTSVHRLVCAALGYKSYQDDGRFPDIRHQLLEVKLQTSPTIDLGLVTPSSTAPLDVPMMNGIQIRHCDVRYAIFYGVAANGAIELANLFLTTGADFFSRFPQFGGRVLNGKLQIPLPASFFES